MLLRATLAAPSKLCRKVATLNPGAAGHSNLLGRLDIRLPIQGK
jgi:hypothetical protein